MLSSTRGLAAALAIAVTFPALGVGVAGSKGPDVLIGGDGRDVLRGQQGNDRLAGSKGPDVLIGGDGRDVLRGQQGNDRLAGSKGPDVVVGGPGRDLIVGGPGSDRVIGGGGNDVVRVDDGRRDRVSCGAGSRDVVYADRRDSIAADCEITRSGPSADRGPISGGSASQRGLYAPDSPWNTRIPADATIDPRSRELVGSLREAADEEGFVLALRRWTVPVYFADAGTPREDVSLTAPWTEYRRLSGVPIPPGARPDPQDDGHLTVIDRERGCEYDLWQARQDPDGGWSASWGNAVRIGGSGAYQGGIAARGSGFASAAGLVWPEELSRGRIDHALVFSYPHPKDGGPVAPATASDGNSTRPDAIPEGARVQLDPALDLDRLGLSDETKIIARALQEYGMILGDNGGALSLYAAHPFGFSSDPWQSIWPSGSFADLSKIPAERFRVLALGPQQPRERFELEADGCADISR